MLAGSLVFRDLEGERELRPGDVVACLAGERGGHRLDNRSGSPATVLIVSTMHSPEINEFPDSGIVWARTSAPGAVTPPATQLAGSSLPFDPLTLP